MVTEVFELCTTFKILLKFALLFAAAVLLEIKNAILTVLAGLFATHPSGELFGPIVILNPLLLLEISILVIEPPEPLDAA